MRCSIYFLAALFWLASSTAGAQNRLFGVPVLPRADFNQLAVRQNFPFFWVSDANQNNRLDPGELAVVGIDQKLNRYMDKEKFTVAFFKAYQALAEIKRQDAVIEELQSGRPTLVTHDFSAASKQDQALLQQLLAAADLIEEIYLRQTGGYAFRNQVARGDSASKATFWRNHGPWCLSPETRGDAFCNAAPSFPNKRSEAYPLDLPQDDAMCAMLQQQPNAKQLLDPFTVVRKQGGKLVAIPYHQIFKRPMKAVATKLKAAARSIAGNAQEQALKAYLLAAAEGFETNQWEAADEAWVAMNATNSNWYLRIGPDEVYFDPCQQKAGFHLSLARIDKQSVTWQQKLTPLRDEMERAIAQLIGPPYRARKVAFHMPDFIQIILNAGDSRHPVGATIGQSLPNWGKVAQEGRGRTVVMSNLYTDPDSKQMDLLKAQALLGQATMAHFTANAEPGLLNIILHEATHNFGPHSDYRIKGQPPKEIFSGKLASTLEELKAQTGGLWFLRLLRKKGLIDDKTLKQAYLKAITWAFGHISRGMVTPTGNVQPYSQLAAVQVGFFMEQGALTFNSGKFTIHFKKLETAIEKLMQRTGRIKATGDAAAATTLIEYYVTGKGHKLVHESFIARKLLPYPKASFLYSVVL